MKKSIYKILVIMLILVSTIVFLPSCKEKPEEPEIMPYGVYYFATHDYSDASGSPWYNFPNSKQRKELYEEAMKYIGHYIVFTPDKIVFGGSIDNHSDYLFSYSKDIDSRKSYSGKIQFNMKFAQFNLPYLNYHYNKEYKYQVLSFSPGDTLKLNYAFFSDMTIPDYIFDGSKGDVGLLRRDPINYNDYI